MRTARSGPAERPAAPPAATGGWRGRRRRRLLVGGAALLLLLLVAAGAAAREALALRRDMLRARAEFDRALALSDPVLADFGSFHETAAALEESSDRLAAAEAALASAERRRRRLGPLLAAAGRLPGWPAGAADIAPLIAAGRGLARAGQEVSAGFSAMTARVDAGREGGEPAGRRLAAGLAEAEPAFGRALAALERAGEERAAVRRERFGGPLGAANGALASFDARYARLLENARLLAELPPAARAVLGLEGPRTYAVLGQNSAELRPTGGFTGTLGLITVEGGAITVEHYQSVYLLERPERGYPPAPAPLARFVGAVEPGRAGWGLRDANWSPDFPTTARTVEEMLARHQDVRVDGVLGFTTFAVGGLLEALGGVSVPGMAEPVTAESWYALAERLIYGPEPNVRVSPGTQENKGEVLEPILRAVLDRVQAADGAELPAVLRALQSLVQRREILVSFRDPAPAALAARYEADGRLGPPPAGDLLAVVDANMTFSKVGPYIDEAIEYDVWLDERGVPRRSRVTLSYQNRITPEQATDPTRRIGGVDVDPATGRWRFNPGVLGTYVRVYIPAESRLLAVLPPGSEAYLEAEAGLLSVGRYVSVPASSGARVSLEYQVPAEGQEPGAYRLRVVKQAGTAGHALTVRVHLPAGARGTPAQAMTAEGDALVYRGRLTRTLDLAVTVTAPP